MIDPAKMRRILPFFLMLSLAFPFAFAVVFDRQPPQLQFDEWRDRFSAAYAVATRASFDDEHIPGESAVNLLDEALCANGLARQTLTEMDNRGVLFPAAGNRRIPSEGALVADVLRNSHHAGDGGKIMGNSLHSSLPAEPLRVIYIKTWEDGDDVDLRLREKFKVAELRAPSGGDFRRDVYPFLLFCETSNGLRLAAFTREFFDVVTATMNSQIAVVPKSTSNLQ